MGLTKTVLDTKAGAVLAAGLVVSVVGYFALKKAKTAAVQAIKDTGAAIYNANPLREPGEGLGAWLYNVTHPTRTPTLEPTADLIARAQSTPGEEFEEDDDYYDALP